MLSRCDHKRTGRLHKMAPTKWDVDSQGRSGAVETFDRTIIESVQDGGERGSRSRQDSERDGAGIAWSKMLARCPRWSETAVVFGPSQQTLKREF